MVWPSGMFRAGSAELVKRLIGLRGDVNFQLSGPGDGRSLGRLFFAINLCSTACAGQLF